MPIVQTKIISNRPETKGQEMNIRAYRWEAGDKTLGVVFGHFAPFTGANGHARLIEEAKRRGVDHFMVVMPETQGHDKERNLFTNMQRKKIVQEANKELDLNIDRVYVTSGSSIKQIMRHLAEEFGNERVVLICGPDRYPTYRKQFVEYKENEDSTDDTNSPDFNKFEIMGLTDRGAEGTSATAVRKSLLDGNEEEFRKLTGYSHEMWEMMAGFVKENEDIAVTSTKRKGIKHLYNPSVSASVKVTPKEFIELIDWLKTQDGKLDDSVNVDYSEKSDGAAFRFGISRSGRFFVEQSNSGPLYSAKDIEDRAQNRDGTINRSGQAWAGVFNKLKESEEIQEILSKYNTGDGVKVVGEIFINAVGHAGKSDDLIAFVGTEYLKAKIGSFCSVIIINCINGDGMPIKGADEMKKELIQASNDEVLFDDVHYEEKFGELDFNPEIAEFDKIIADAEKEAKMSVVDILSSRKKSEAEIKNQINAKIDELMKKFDDKFRELFKKVGGKWGPDREGIVIKLANDTMLKVTSDVFRDFKKAQHDRDKPANENYKFYNKEEMLMELRNTLREAHISSSVDKCMEIAEGMCEKVNEAGGQLFIIGGATRDYVMGKTPNDLDMMTTLDPQTYADLFGTKDIRHRKDRILVVPVVEGEEFETSCVLNKRSIEEHLEHCDLTCNAMAMDIRTKKIIDPTGGQQDIANKIVRGTKYYIDQWNVGEGRGGLVRFFVFLARLGFKPDPVSVAGIKKYSELRGGSIKLQPYIFNKAFDKIANAKYAKKAIKLFQECGFHESLMQYQRHYAKFCIQNKLTLPGDDVDAIQAEIDAHEAEKAAKEAKAALKKKPAVEIEAESTIIDTSNWMNEKFEGNDLLLYTTSKDWDYDKYFEAKELRFGNNAGNMYGNGIYTTIEKPADAGVGYSDKVRNNLYGSNIFTFKADASKFMYLTYDIFQKSPLFIKLKKPSEKNFVAAQLKYFGLDIDPTEITPNEEITSGKAAYLFSVKMKAMYPERKDGTPATPIDGFVYYGKNDGYTGVVWTPYNLELVAKENGEDEEELNISVDGYDETIEEMEAVIYDGNPTDEKREVYRLLKEFRGENTPIGDFTNIVIHDDKTIDCKYKATVPQVFGNRHVFTPVDNEYTNKIARMGYRFGKLDAWIGFGVMMSGRVDARPETINKALVPAAVSGGVYVSGMPLDGKKLKAITSMCKNNGEIQIRKSYLAEPESFKQFKNIAGKDCICDAEQVEAFTELCPWCEGINAGEWDETTHAPKKAPKVAKPPKEPKAPKTPKAKKAAVPEEPVEEAPAKPIKKTRKKVTESFDWTKHLI